MQSIHEPRSEFVDRLESYIVRGVQRHNRATASRGWMHILRPKPWVLGAVSASLVVLAVGSAMVWRQETSLFRVVEGDARVGETVRSNRVAGAVLALLDGSRVEMRSSSELAVERAVDGIRIRLHRGGIIVNAAKQRTGHLYVQTKDMTVSVVGTVFLVNADPQGSRVAVIEGEVSVQQGNTEQSLLPGDQVATHQEGSSPPVVEEIAWSRNLEAHAVKLKEQLALKLEPLLAPPVQVLPAQVPSAPETSTLRPADTPKWEVIAIRPCAGGQGGARGGGASGAASGAAAGGVRIDPSFLRVTCMSLRFLIQDAYVRWLEPNAMRRSWIFPVTGGPEWLDTDLYSIDARPVNPPVSTQTMGGPMLQALLEERFKLRLRREVRQEPVYELRVAEGGFKAQPLKDGECESRVTRFEGLSDPERAVARQNLQKQGKYAFRCGSVRIGNGLARKVNLDGMPVYELTNYLSLDRIILDKTGIQGLFDISLTYGQDVSPMGRRDISSPANPVDAAAAPTPRVPSGADPVFDALREQLGLELVPTMGSRTYYFVEHVERPAPN